MDVAAHSTLLSFFANHINDDGGRERPSIQRAHENPPNATEIIFTLAGLGMAKNSKISRCRRRLEIISKLNLAQKAFSLLFVSSSNQARF